MNVCDRGFVSGSCSLGECQTHGCLRSFEVSSPFSTHLSFWKRAKIFLCKFFNTFLHFIRLLCCYCKLNNVHLFIELNITVIDL